ncbi:putative membrane protein [Wickerhamomyces ciferrii]|uniref:Membrane protein n=1 Tax=Wickerhamomyces ciferrii (strain ATCC 14091 / BCRC 22168 / CBS 111 / JCM 3599 / NBRC 0793 / NRRL Y-1031 F-60-10) TaxID=1206466 RepID=K0K6F2_WICCF|nr:uncharacterized protein BN7_53 [Wickerhamomyces ciferrii]CCH40520.1 putative membrane protein [Wickerhamomyces ciferrii]
MVSQIASDQLLYQTPQQLLFDAVLSKRGFDDVVVRGKLFRSVKVPLLTQIERWLLDLPHNSIEYPLWMISALLSIIFTFVPLVGPIVLVFVNAPNRGYNFHSRYYELKGIDTRQRLGFYSSRRLEYFTFGIMTGVLQQIPFISTFFVFTSVTGAALWAAEFENQFAKRRQGLGLNDVKYNQRRDAIIMGPFFEFASRGGLPSLDEEAERRIAAGELYRSIIAFGQPAAIPVGTTTSAMH